MNIYVHKYMHIHTHSHTVIHKENKKPRGDPRPVINEAKESHRRWTHFNPLVICLSHFVYTGHILLSLHTQQLQLCFLRWLCGASRKHEGWREPERLSERRTYHSTCQNTPTHSLAPGTGRSPQQHQQETGDRRQETHQHFYFMGELVKERPLMDHVLQSRREERRGERDASRKRREREQQQQGEPYVTSGGHEQNQTGNSRHQDQHTHGIYRPARERVRGTAIANNTSSSCCFWRCRSFSTSPSLSCCVSSNTCSCKRSRSTCKAATSVMTPSAPICCTLSLFHRSNSLSSSYRLLSSSISRRSASTSRGGATTAPPPPPPPPPPPVPDRSSFGGGGGGGLFLRRVDADRSRPFTRSPPEVPLGVELAGEELSRSNCTHTHEFVPSFTCLTRLQTYTHTHMSHRHTCMHTHTHTRTRTRTHSHSHSHNNTRINIGTNTEK